MSEEQKKIIEFVVNFSNCLHDHYKYLEDKEEITMPSIVINTFVNNLKILIENISSDKDLYKNIPSNDYAKMFLLNFLTDTQAKINDMLELTENNENIKTATASQFFYELMAYVKTLKNNVDFLKF